MHPNEGLYTCNSNWHHFWTKWIECIKLPIHIYSQWYRVRVMVFISWLSVLLMEETGENHRRLWSYSLMLSAWRRSSICQFLSLWFETNGAQAPQSTALKASMLTTTPLIQHLENYWPVIYHWGTKWISSSYHQRVTCFHHDITEKIDHFALNNNG
jgi:hypothetical protein